MKISHIIIKSSLTKVVLLYQQKSYPFTKHFLFQKNVIEMLLNNDIQPFFGSNNFTFSKGKKMLLCTLLKF